MAPARNTPRRSRRGANRPPADPEFEDIDCFDSETSNNAGTDSAAASPASTTTSGTPASTPATSPEPEYSSGDEEYEEPARVSTRSRRAFHPYAVNGGRKIKRPANMFMLFRKDWIKRNGKETEGKNRALISKEVGILWHALPVEEREVWKINADEEKRLHQEKYPGYVYAPRTRQKTRASPASSRGGYRGRKARQNTPPVEAAGGRRGGKPKTVSQAAARQVTTRSRTSRVAHAIKIEDTSDEDIAFPSTPTTDGEFSPASTPTVNGDASPLAGDEDDFPGSPSTAVGDIEDEPKVDESTEVATYMEEEENVITTADISTLDFDEDEDDEGEERGVQYFKDIFANDAFTSEEDALQEALADLELKNEMEAQPACAPNDPWDVLPFDFDTSATSFDSAIESFETPQVPLPDAGLGMDTDSAMKQLMNDYSEPPEFDSWWSDPFE